MAKEMDVLPIEVQELIFDLRNLVLWKTRLLGIQTKDLKCLDFEGKFMCEAEKDRFYPYLPIFNYSFRSGDIRYELFYGEDYYALERRKSPYLGVLRFGR